MTRARSVVATSFALVALRMPAARAAEIRWKSAGCDAKAQVAADVEKSLGHTLASVETADFEVTAAQASSKWNMTLVTVDRETGERRARNIEGTTCQDAAAAVAVAISIAVRAAEDSSTEEVPVAEPEQTEPNSPEQRAPALPDRPTKVKAAFSTERSLFGFAAASALVDIGTLPSPAPGFKAGAGIAWKFLTAGIAGGLLAPERRSVVGGGGEFHLAFGVAELCAEQMSAGVKPLACAGLEVGSLGGHGVDVARSRSGSALWLAVDLDVGGRVILSQNFAATVRLGATLPLNRRKFAFSDNVQVFEPSAIGARAGLGLDFRVHPASPWVSGGFGASRCSLTA
jgi:hypothetical protein